ncbi:putative holin [Caldimonas sp. KR1-144]|uniref:putative holin n=1 Tax=Caldimonas sp. KR1-144 TaxID=3400911 RepID=UPI003BFD2FE6
MFLLSGVRERIPALLKLPRTTLWLMVAAALLLAVALVSLVQLPVVLYKCALIAIGAVLGYWVDRGLFPYSRPDGYLERDWRLGTDEPQGDADFRVVAEYQPIFIAALLRRAVIVAAVIVGLATGL